MFKVVNVNVYLYDTAVLLPGEVFRQFADELLRPSIRKGMQPLFTILQELYKDSQKVSLILEITVPNAL